MTTTVTQEFANFDAKISMDNPLPDYGKLMEEKMRVDAIVPENVFQECWKKISAAARETIWQILFNDKNQPTKEQLQKASELMKMLKEDSAFYQASEYNNWVVKVRDELLKRNMLDFWRDEMVKKELGPCWARDSDLFDDIEDPEPANFYKYANCEAPWLKEKKKNEGAVTAENAAALIASALTSTENPKTDKKLRKISPDNAVEDYKHNVDAQGDIDGDDEEAYKEIFAEARKMIWQLLFSEPTLSTENYKKAADLLYAYKRDAIFYSPYDYNDWIPSVRDELLKRKYFDFWQNEVVKKELGLCWARDSDYFDDMEDPKPHEFYKVGEDFIKNQQK